MVYNYYFSKVNAQKAAKKQRKHGWNIRVVKAPKTAKGVAPYHLYGRRRE